MLAPDEHGGHVHAAAAAINALPEELQPVARNALALDELIRSIADNFSEDLEDIAVEVVPRLQAALEAAGAGGSQARAVSLAMSTAELAAILDDAGLDEAVAGLLVRYQEILDSALEGVRLVGIDLGALSLDAELLQALIDLDAERWTLYGAELADVARRSILGQTFTGRGLDDVIDDIETAIGSSRSAAVRDARTMMQTYSRNTHAHVAEAAGLEHFLYIGPATGNVRPFCSPLVGKVLTKDQVQSLDNGQLPDPLRTGGGFNCRHHWTPVPPPSEANGFPVVSDEDLRRADQSERRQAA